MCHNCVAICHLIETIFGHRVDDELLAQFIEMQPVAPPNRFRQEPRQISRTECKA